MTKLPDTIKTVELLQAQPGDVVVCTVNDGYFLSVEEKQNLIKMIESKLPSGVKVLLLDGITLQLLRPTLISQEDLLNSRNTNSETLMTKLTDEQLEAHEIYVQINPERKAFILDRKDYEALLAEVREGRKVVEIGDEQRMGHGAYGAFYRCPSALCSGKDIHFPFNHCPTCGVALKWKD